MKTRKDLYGKEAAEIIRVLSAYNSLYEEQVYRLFSGKRDKIVQILRILIKQSRIHFDETYGYLYFDQPSTDYKTLQCFWVLLDFIEKIGIHMPGSYPVVISYFAGQEVYEIIYIGIGEETIIQYTFQTLLSKTPAKRIIVVECPEQIPNCMIPNTVGYCVVSKDGEVEYYQIDREV